jgi:hypothetical protein
MESKKLQPSFQETVDFVATFQNEEGSQVSISSAHNGEYPIREEYFVPYEDYSEGVVLYGISM